MTLQKDQLNQRLKAMNLSLTEADYDTDIPLRREVDRDFVCLVDPRHAPVRSSLRSLLVRSPNAARPACPDCLKEFRIARVNRHLAEHNAHLHLQNYDTTLAGVGLFTCDLNPSHRPFTTSIPYVERGSKRCPECVHDERLLALNARIEKRNATVAPQWRVTVLDCAKGTTATFRCASGHVYTTAPSTVLNSNLNGCRKCYRRDAEMVNDLLRLQGNPIELTGTYFNANTKTEFRCLANPNHPNFFARPTDKVWKNSRCKQCAKEQRHAATLQRRAEKHQQARAV